MVQPRTRGPRHHHVNVPTSAVVFVLISCSFVAVNGFGPISQSHNNGMQKVSRVTATRLYVASVSETSRLKRTSGLTNWAKENDIQLGGVSVEQSESSGGGLGLLATQELNSGNVVLTVPSNLALTVEAPGDGPDDSSLVSEFFDRKVVRDAPWFVQFSAYLNAMDYTKRKKETDMVPWLDSLPRSFDTPLHWTKEARQELQYPYLVDAISRQESEWNTWHKTVTASAKGAMAQMTIDDFVWGLECARSRAFSGAYTGSAFNPLPYAFTLLLVTVYVGLGFGSLEQAANGAALVLCASILKDFVVPKLFSKKKYVICPVIDMANHKGVGATGDVSFEFFGDAYSLALSSSVAKGSELFISYGARSNDQLLQYYGFVEEDNPHDVYVMPSLREWNIEALEQATGRSFSAGRLQKLDRAGLLGSADAQEESGDNNAVANRSGGVVVARTAGIDPAILQALRALVSSEQEWSNAGQAVGNFAEEGSGGAENERLARVAARTALELELSSKPTTKEQDEEILKRLTSTKETEAEDLLAVKFRLEKKKLLLETIQGLQ